MQRARAGETMDTRQHHARHSQHAGWPDMMKTWIGPSWTGSGSGFIDEFATPKQVSISSAMVVRLCERKVGANSAQSSERPAVVWWVVSPRVEGRGRGGEGFGGGVDGLLLS